uniref:Uncharacterized protein n=1 Tax=Tanacetum cinerariifolium TaxID=118510 RepID=A0A699TNV7_TANCI|nr:hypothetical protein [Tanacetum cinerariifolium]
MATTIEQQTTLDESLVPSMQRLRIRRSNFQLPSDIQSKEATLFRAFQVTADVPEIYIALQEKALELTVSDCLTVKCFRDFITESTLTLPISSGKILCIKWSTNVRR